VDAGHFIASYRAGATASPDSRGRASSRRGNPVVPGGAHPIEHDAPFHGVSAEDTALLLRRIEELGLDVRTIAGSHGRIATYAELVAAVRDSGAVSE